MRSVNKVILVGNLTRDPEMKQTQNGHNICTFGLATNRDWMTRDNRRQTSSEFHELVAWAKLGEICCKYLKKGKLIYVEGYLKTRSWMTPENVKKFRTEIVVQDMIMLDKKGAEEGDSAEEEMLQGSPTEEADATGGAESQLVGVSAHSEDLFEG
ncbi:MAG: Single-stranded DNA-binding protein [Candidatus Peregrinibacteria bacterium GW2011_GWA2_47_7]|nr:MAG: Single-stranded DNA-binding protein [Candidatus Peregrinibacteria bacterium GW2011_GWA2_47_7]